MKIYLIGNYQLLNSKSMYQYERLVYSMLQKENNCYTFYPRLSTQIIDFSDIQNKITDYNWLIQ